MNGRCERVAGWVVLYLGSLLPRLHVASSLRPDRFAVFSVGPKARHSGVGGCSGLSLRRSPCSGTG
jgi:hypothetical protein